MRRTFRQRNKPSQKPKINYPINEQIRSELVMVIDENQKPLGEMTTRAAIDLAQERGLDLIAVAPKANPPVTKFIDQGKFKYEQMKQLHKQKIKQKKVETKGIRMSFRIGDSDRQLKMNQAKKFLAKGHKIKIEMLLRGRERQHKDMAREQVETFIKELGDKIVTEQKLTMQGPKIFVIVANKPT